MDGIQVALLGATLAATSGLPGDINGDGKVDVLDLQIMAASWNKQVGQAGYDADCDLNGDNKVNVFDLQIMAENWGKEITVSVSIQKNPLGQSTGFTGSVVGKVYVPSRYGGRLTVSGAGVQLIYTNGADLQPVTAQQVYQGDLSGSVVAQGNPCVYTMPSGRPGWYYIRFTQATPVTISSAFVEAGEADYRPWNGWWWPFATSSGPTLYNFNGPLDKYDRVWGTTARSREQLVQGSGDGWWGHCWGWSIAA